MDNKAVVERIFGFATAVRGRNDAIAQALQRATIPLLEFAQPLASASQDDLLQIAGIGPATVGFIQRIIAGDEIDAVVADVPKIQRNPQRRPSEYQPNDRGEWDGSWDNVVKDFEGS